VNDDYCQAEINTIINNLLCFSRDKLKNVEIDWLRERQGIGITQKDRDILIGIYDRIGETNE